jgi:hypothetical protein
MVNGLFQNPMLFSPRCLLRGIACSFMPHCASINPCKKQHGLLKKLGSASWKP